MVDCAVPHDRRESRCDPTAERGRRRRTVSVRPKGHSTEPCCSFHPGARAPASEAYSRCIRRHVACVDCRARESKVQRIVRIDSAGLIHHCNGLLKAIAAKSSWLVLGVGSRSLSKPQRQVPPRSITSIFCSPVALTRLRRPRMGMSNRTTGFAALRLDRLCATAGGRLSSPDGPTPRRKCRGDPGSPSFLARQETLRPAVLR
jgi:hypothetical protein